MHEVFQKTRELGEVMMRSDEYVTMKLAEERAMQNPVAVAAMEEFMEAREQLEEVMSRDDPDVGWMKSLSTQMELIQDKLQTIDDIAALTEARNEFSRLVNQVNQVLRFIVTGEMEDGEGCGHSCDHCAGCSGTLH